MRMKALKRFRYAGKPYRPGDELDMRESHAATMHKIKKAIPVPAGAKRTYQRRDMVAEPVIDLPNFRKTSDKD